MNKKETIIAEWEERKGKFPQGRKNSITDVEGVRVGHLTVSRNVKDESGKTTIIRTGMTAVLPYPMEKEMRLFSGSFIFRGKNEITGYEVMENFCYLNSPIVITNSFNVGRVYNTILSYGFTLGRDEIWPPLVIGIDDSYLNEMRKSVLEEKEILNVFHHASKGKVEEGSEGIGLGLRAFGWKGGIGTSSRSFNLGSQTFTSGALVASNHSNQKTSENSENNTASEKNENGSLVIIVGVDVPLVPYQIKQIASSLVVSLPSALILKNCKDSITCVLFTTANPMSMAIEGPLMYDFQLIDDSYMETVISAGTEAIKEAIFHSLLKAASIKGRLGREAETIPENEFNRLLRVFQGLRYE